MNELLQLMHDTMGKVVRIKSSSQLLQSGNYSSKEEEAKLFSIIDANADELNKVLDAYYISQKNNQK